MKNKNYQSAISHYPVYKDSGVEWSGDVPEHWQVVRAKDICQIFVPQRDKPDLNEKNGTAWITSDLLGNTKIDSGKFKYFVDEEEIKYKRIRKVPANSVLASCVGEFSLTAINKFSVIINQQIQAYSSIKKQSSEFINYQIQANVTRLYYERVATETTIKYINKEKFSLTPLYLPPLPEQKAIAYYLDTKTAQIDRKINLLTEKATLYGNLKQSLINETVTRGLDKTVPMKDSGIEWLGDVPEHWEIKHLKNLAEIKGGRDSKAVELEEGGYPVYGSGGVFGRSSKYLHKKPSVLLGRKGTVDKPLFVTEPFWSVDTMFYTDIKNNVDPKFFYYQCLTIQFGLYQYGSAVPSMAQNVLRQILFATPNYPEQKAIADYLDTKTAQIDQIIQTINTQIEKLKELRKTLINDVVTGKIKVTQ